MSITTTETGYDSITHTFSTVSEITNNMNKIKPYELCIATDIDAVYYKDNLCNLHHIKDYTLPTATASVLGGVKIGSNLEIINGVLSANIGVNTCMFPIGSILMFDDHTINPATLYTGTTWVRRAENRSIRGAANGEGTGLTGGSDTVVISQANLPNINLTADDHTHTRGSMEITGNLNINGTVAVSSSASGAFSMVGVGQGFQHGTSGDNSKFGANFYASHAWTGATSGASNLNVPLGGSGVALNVTNAFYKMHIWKRLT